MSSTTIHYNSSMKLTELKSQGQGQCGQNGYISGYHGMVNCKACQKIVKQEQSQSFTVMKTALK